MSQPPDRPFSEGAVPADPAARTPLDRERIVRVALELIDTLGVQGCSMRRLGQELRVEAMTLYHHFESKAALLDAVLEELATEVHIADPVTHPPIERIRMNMRSFRQLAVKHPRAFVLLAARRFNTARAFDVYERTLKMFADCGLTPKEQAYWFRLIGGFASGSGMAYVASVEQIPDASSLKLEQKPDAIPFPRVRAAAPFLRVEGLDEAFEFGLDTLLVALKQYAARVQ